MGACRFAVISLGSRGTEQGGDDAVGGNGQIDEAQLFGGGGQPVARKEDQRVGDDKRQVEAFDGLQAAERAVLGAGDHRVARDVGKAEQAAGEKDDIVFPRRDLAEAGGGEFHQARVPPGRRRFSARRVEATRAVHRLHPGSRRRGFRRGRADGPACLRAGAFREREEDVNVVERRAGEGSVALEGSIDALGGRAEFIADFDEGQSGVARHVGDDGAYAHQGRPVMLDQLADALGRNESFGVQGGDAVDDGALALEDRIDAVEVEDAKGAFLVLDRLGQLAMGVQVPVQDLDERLSRRLDLVLLDSAVSHSSRPCLPSPPADPPPTSAPAGKPSRRLELMSAASAPVLIGASRRAPAVSGEEVVVGCIACIRGVSLAKIVPQILGS